MNDVLHLDDDSFEGQISESELPVLVDFYGDRCPPCEMLVPIFSEMAQDYRGRVIFAKLNASRNARISQQVDIRGTPTLILFKKGAAADTIIGLRPEKELREWLDSAL